MRFLSFVAVLAALASDASARAQASKADAAGLAGKVRALLQTHCHRCHGKDGSRSGRIDYITDLDKLVQKGKVVPGDPLKSPLFSNIVSGEMPPAGEKPRPSNADVAVLKAWIEGAGGRDKPAQPIEKVAKRRFVAPGDNLEMIYAHLRRLSPSSRRFQRYFTFTNLHNNGKLGAADLRLSRAALAKLLNSLSWKRDVVVPRRIDPDGAVYAVDVRELGWERQNLWRQVLASYPYGLTHRESPASPRIRAVAGAIAKIAGEEMPLVRADWFLAAASRPPLYHTLLRLPKKASSLERWLNVDVEANFQRGSLVRAGFTASGVSRQNRMVERHATSFGAYWKSYDFKNNNVAGNLFQFPLGPVSSENRFNARAFKHDGGEIIFHLPNGLQGYLLIDARGERIDAGPTEVVRDKLETSGSVAVVNGVSCMACHAHGPIKDFKDTVRAGSVPLPGEARDKVSELYPKPEILTRLLDADESRFLAALDRTAGRFLKVGPDRGKNIKDFPEMIGPRVRAHLLVEVDVETAAYELGLKNPATLKAYILANKELQRLGLLPLARGNAIKREAWESMRGTFSPFQETARTLDLGTPYRQR